MDVCEEILQSNEISNIDVNDKVFDLVLQEFINSVDMNFDLSDCETPGEKVRTLMFCHIYRSDYAKLFYEILAKHNYNMNWEIKDAMISLGHLEKPKNNKKIIKELLSSPIIQDISFNGKNQFTIYSELYGKFVFELASYYFRKNDKMTKYIKSEELPGGCHSHAYFMSEVLKDFYAITSLCQYFFIDGYYHSYTYDKERNVIIDLCYNSIVDKEQYYRIFQPKEISVIHNGKVEEELALTNLKTEQYFDRCDLLKIALYKQYLEAIGYKGSLEEAPYLRKMQLL